MKLRDLLKGKPNKSGTFVPLQLVIPDSVSALLSQDDVSILIERFCKLDQESCRDLILLWRDEAGRILVRTNMSKLTVFRLLGLAINAVDAEVDEDAI